MNPVAKGGALGKLWSDWEPGFRKLFGPIRVYETREAGGGVTQVQNALCQGARRIFSLGGDGTHSEVLHGMMVSGVPSEAMSLGLLPAGTGGDFSRLFQGGHDLFATAQSLLSPIPHRIDVGKVVLPHRRDGAITRYFLNITSFGIGGLVDKFANESSKRWGGFQTFLLASLRAAAVYKPALVRLVIDGEDRGVFPTTNICVCNGRYGGGGMLHSPHSRIGDGQFEIVVLRKGTLMQMGESFVKLYSGNHLDTELVTVFSGKHIEAECQSNLRAYVDIDGEYYGTLPVEISLCPQAIQLENPLKEGVL